MNKNLTNEKSIFQYTTLKKANGKTTYRMGIKRGLSKGLKHKAKISCRFFGNMQVFLELKKYTHTSLIIIPADVVKRFGIEDGTLVMIEKINNKFFITKVGE